LNVQNGRKWYAPRRFTSTGKKGGTTSLGNVEISSVKSESMAAISDWLVEEHLEEVVQVFANAEEKDPTYRLCVRTLRACKSDHPAMRPGGPDGSAAAAAPAKKEDDKPNAAADAAAPADASANKAEL
jgi:hypothetical protein